MHPAPLVLWPLQADAQAGEPVTVGGLLLFLAMLFTLVAGFMYLKRRFDRAVNGPPTDPTQARIDRISVRLPLWIAGGLVVMAVCVYVVGWVGGEPFRTSSALPGRDVRPDVRAQR